MFNLLHSPSGETIRLFNEKDIEYSIGFLLKSVALYVLICLMGFWKVEGNSIATDFTIGFFFLLTYCLNGYLVYFFLKRKSKTRPPLNSSQVLINNVYGKKVMGSIKTGEKIWNYSVLVFNQDTKIWIIMSRYMNNDTNLSMQYQIEKSIELTDK